MKEINADDIKKALRFCINGNQCEYICPFDDEEDDCNKCTSALAKASLDLINRQQAEIERLTNLKADELEGKGNKCFDAGCFYGVTKFAERLKSRIGYINVSNAVIRIQIDHLVKEMTEVNENGKV